MKTIVLFTTMIFASSVLACPQFYLSNVTCTDPAGSESGLSMSLQGNVFTGTSVFGTHSTTFPHSEFFNGTQSTIECVGNKIVTTETFENYTAISETSFINGALVTTGQYLSTRCDYPTGCNNGVYTFDSIVTAESICK
jgi:hypothetical protein